MGQFTVTHEIACDATTFWKVFNDENFNKKFYLEDLGYPSYEITEQREQGSEVVRKSVAVPKWNLPGPLAKLFGSGFRIAEEGQCDKTTNLYQFKDSTSTMADKIRIEGSVRIEPVGNKVRRTVEITLEVKIFGVGGLMESTLEKQLREEWDKSAAFMSKWIAEGKAA